MIVTYVMHSVRIPVLYRHVGQVLVSAAPDD